MNIIYTHWHHHHHHWVINPNAHNTLSMSDQAMDLLVLLVLVGFFAMALAFVGYLMYYVAKSIKRELVYRITGKKKIKKYYYRS